MTTKYKITDPSYGNIIYYLKQDNFFSIDEWAAVRSQTEHNIWNECIEIFRELQIKASLHGSCLEDFVVLQTEDIVDSFIGFKLDDMKQEIFKDFSFFFRKMERLGQLQEYLRELKQLD